MSQLHQFDVQGMTCGHCERAVTNAVQELDPQAVVSIDRAHNRVDVTSTQPRDALAAAIADEGYAVAT
ncbi:MAG: heavy-metal-associated domain-containing protein [Burkholderiaceae bacterium]|nr:heavy-metal-associated domain-containing protein [Burkholderiaceae bacterium]